jgi:hypothetical protein
MGCRAVPAVKGEVRFFPDGSRAYSKGSVMEGIPVVTAVRPQNNDFDSFCAFLDFRITFRHSTVT